MRANDKGYGLFGKSMNNRYGLFGKSMNNRYGLFGKSMNNRFTSKVIMRRSFPSSASDRFLT